MYVTGGQYKGHKILIPNCAKPTLSKVRESVFNILFSEINEFENKIFLDLFSGSGIISMEALSRGFKTISIDNDKKAIQLIKNNLKIAKTNYEIIFSDAIKYIEKTEIKPSVIYIDPPWDMNYEEVITKAINKFKNSIIIIEYDKKRVNGLDEIYSKTIAPFKEKVYGRCKLDFIKT